MLSDLTVSVKCLFIRLLSCRHCWAMLVKCSPKTLTSWANFFLTMSLQPVAGFITLDDGSEAFFKIRGKAADYFGIKGVQPKMQVFQKKAYTYHRHSELNSNITKEVRVPSSRVSRPPILSKGTDKRVRVPTSFISPRGNVRTYTIAFPRKATYRNISQWLATHCTRNKPHYFISEAGKRRVVFDESEFLLDDES